METHAVPSPYGGRWWWFFSRWAVSDPMDCSLPGSCVHGIPQARTLKGIVMSSSRGSSWPRDWILISCITSWFFTAEPPGKPHMVEFYLAVKRSNVVIQAALWVNLEILMLSERSQKQKRPHVVRVLSNGVSRRGKSTETGTRLVIDRGCGQERQEWPLMGLGLLCGVMGTLLNWLQWCFQNSMNIPQIIELHPVKGWIAWNVNYVSRKCFFLKRIRIRKSRKG